MGLSNLDYAKLRKAVKRSTSEDWEQYIIDEYKKRVDHTMLKLKICSYICHKYNTEHVLCRFLHDKVEDSYEVDDGFVIFHWTQPKREDNVSGEWTNHSRVIPFTEELAELWPDECIAEGIDFKSCLLK